VPLKMEMDLAPFVLMAIDSLMDGVWDATLRDT